MEVWFSVLFFRFLFCSTISAFEVAFCLNSSRRPAPQRVCNTAAGRDLPLVVRGSIADRARRAQPYTSAKPQSQDVLLPQNIQECFAKTVKVSRAQDEANTRFVRAVQGRNSGQDRRAAF